MDLVYMDSTNNNLKKTIAVGVVSFLLGFGANWLWISGRQAAPAPGDIQDLGSVGVADTADKIVNDEKNEAVAEKDSSAGNTKEIEGKEEMPPDLNTIVVTSQGAGDKVVLDRLVLKKRGWAVIYEDERGRPMRILGAHRFPAGDHREVVVELLRATLPGRVYYAMIHDDDGDDEFDFRKDLPLTDETGGPIMMRFMTAEVF
jgi:hypothetical protein